jgi:AcrR family transcriptional regulator
MPERVGLRERKQQRARDAIIDAAFDLFARRKFDEVTVDDIAELAEVGRTTFFRYFGDKREVVLADDQRLLDELTAMLNLSEAAPPQDVRAALSELRELVLLVCDKNLSDPRFALFSKLLEENPDLRDRYLRKLHGYAEQLADTLITRGSPERIAVVASELALACYFAGARLAGQNARKLRSEVLAAFGELEPLTIVESGTES